MTTPSYLTNMPNELEQLKKRVTELETLVGRNLRPGEHVFTKNVRFDTKSKIIGAIFAGIATGAGTSVPLGWTCVQNSADNWTVTHNLNTTKYVVLAVPQNSNGGFIANVVQSANSFTIVTFTGGGGTNVGFILQLV